MTTPSGGRRGHILHLATTHGATDPRIVQKEARTLAAAGHRVGVVLPHDADGAVGEVAIHAVPRPADGRDRLLRTTRAVVRRALAEAGPETVFHLHESELLPLGIGLALRGRRVVYDAHEDSPRQAHHQMWIPAPLRRPAGWTYAGLEAVAGRLFDGIIAAVPAIHARYPAAKTVLVQNYPIVGELGGGRPRPADPGGVSRLVYVGAITESRGLREMLGAVRQLAAERDVVLDLAGSIHPPSLRDTVDAAVAEGLVEYHGYLDRPAVAEVLGRARAGLVVLHPTPQYLQAYPTKLFEYMAAGLPVIASDFPIIRPFVAPSDCGRLVDPEDVGAIADAVRWVLDHPAEAAAMGARGQSAVREEFAWEGEGARLLRFYQAVLAGDRRPGRAAGSA